jgi:hypothetical protein
VSPRSHTHTRTHTLGPPGPSPVGPPGSPGSAGRPPRARPCTSHSPTCSGRAGRCRRLEEGGEGAVGRGGGGGGGETGGGVGLGTQTRRPRDPTVHATLLEVLCDCAPACLAHLTGSSPGRHPVVLANPQQPTPVQGYRLHRHNTSPRPASCPPPFFQPTQHAAGLQDVGHPVLVTPAHPGGRHQGAVQGCRHRQRIR